MSSGCYPTKKLERDPHNTLKELSLKLGRTYTQLISNATIVLKPGWNSG
jgi:hypothetical protein